MVIFLEEKVVVREEVLFELMEVGRVKVEKVVIKRQVVREVLAHILGRMDSNIKVDMVTTLCIILLEVMEEVEMELIIMVKVVEEGVTTVAVDLVAVVEEVEVVI